MARQNSENCGRICDSNTSLFLLATRIILASPNFGQANTVKTAPQPLIVNSAFVALYVGIILPINPIPISLFSFELEAEG